MTTATRGRLTARELASIEKANALAADFFLKDAAGTTGWLSAKRADYLRDLLFSGGETTRTGERERGGHFDLDDGTRWAYSIGPRSPVNGCGFFSVRRVNSAADWERAEEMGQERAYVATCYSRAVVAVWGLGPKATLAEKMALRDALGMEALADRLTELDAALATYDVTGERDFPGERLPLLTVPAAN